MKRIRTTQIRRLTLIAAFSAACASDDSAPDPAAEDEPGASGEVERVEIGPEGGRLEVDGAMLEIPPGALDETVELSMAVIEPDYDDPIASVAVELEPHGLQFAVPATLSLTVTGEAPDAPYVMRGEAAEGPFDPIASEADDDTVTAELSGFSVYFIGDGLLHRFNPQFESDGVGFSSIPVDIALIEGPGAPIFEVQHIGTMQGQGKLWYGRDRCVGFSAGGLGKVDDLGGSAARVGDFPRLGFGNDMGRVTVPDLWEPESSLLAPLDPNFVRTDAIRSFRWGVALDEDGRLETDSSGRPTIGVRIDGDDTVATGVWSGSDEDAGYGVTLLSSATTEPPSESRFCAFVGARTQVPPNDPRVCLDEEVFGSGSRTITRCFDNGHLDGDYTVVDDETGELLVSGEFKAGVPDGSWKTVDGWTRISGSYADGQRVGVWTEDRRGDDGHWRTLASYTIGGRVEGPLGPYEPADGTHEQFFDDEPYSIETRGAYIDGLANGLWFTYDEGGTLRSVHTWDADDPEVVGDVCSTVDDEYTCVDRLESRLTRWREYDWGECISMIDFMREVTYDRDGNQSDPMCFDISGDRSNPDLGAVRSCPTYCDV